MQFSVPPWCYLRSVAIYHCCASLERASKRKTESPSVLVREAPGVVSLLPLPLDRSSLAGQPCTTMHNQDISLEPMGRSATPTTNGNGSTNASSINELSRTTTKQSDQDSTAIVGKEGKLHSRSRYWDNTALSLTLAVLPLSSDNFASPS